MTGDLVEKIKWLQEEIKKQFSITYLGIFSQSLGIELIFHEHGITMTHRRYISTRLEDFGLNDCNPSPTPMLEGTNMTLSINTSGVPFEYPQYYLNKKANACKAMVQFCDISCMIIF